MLRLAIIFAAVVISLSWYSVHGGGDGARLNGFARWAVSQTADAPVVETVDVPAPRAVTQPLGRKVMIPADANGQFEGQFRLNDRSVPAMVDTGATLMAINVSTALKAGIRLKASDFQHEVQTANGRTLAAAVVIDSVEIGRIRVKDVEALILQDAALHTTLVGMSFLRRLDRFQVEDHTLLLVQ